MIRFIQSFVLSITLILGVSQTPAWSAPQCKKVFLDQAAASSSIDPVLEKQIVELGDKQEIPLKIYENYSVNDIAQALVERVEKQEEQFKKDLPIGEENARITLDDDDVDIILFFWKNNLNSIREKGFINQHESGNSSGTYNPKERLAAEDRFTGVKLGTSKPALQLRPKSAFLNIREDVPLAEKYHEIMDQYGNVGAVMKNSVKQQSMWTSTDSLGLGGQYYSINIDYSGQSLVEYRGTYSRKSFPCKSPCTQYYEAIIYGQVDLDDVDYFFVADEDEVNDQLKSIGKPIYLTHPLTFDKRIIFKKDRLLYAGDEKKLKSSEASSAFTEMFEIAKIKEKVTFYKEATSKNDLFEISVVETPKNNYAVYTPAKSKIKFRRFVTSLESSLKSLNRSRINVKKVFHVDKVFMIQEGIAPDESEVTKLDQSHKKDILNSLKQLISKLAKRKIHLRGLSPDALLADYKDDLIVRFHKGQVDVSSIKDVWTLFEKESLPLWKDYFNKTDFQELKNFIKEQKNLQS